MKAILTLMVMLGIPAAFWNYYLRESPDVQYSLSAAIPLAFQESPKVAKELQPRDEFVQQIEVANSGNAEAKAIVVKIPKAITQFRVTKHSRSVKVESFQTANSFELDYPSLPPASRFQITVKTDGAPLAESQLEVSHQGGKASMVSPGSTSGKASYLSLAFSIVLPLFYLFMAYVFFRDEAKYLFLFRHSSRSRDISKLLTQKKPWYIHKNDWPEVFVELIQRAIYDYASMYSGGLGNVAAYKVLTFTKPDAIEQGEWDKVRKSSSERLSDVAIEHAKRLSNQAELLDLLNTSWPNGLSEANKEKLSYTISVIYFDWVFSKSSADQLVQILTENKQPPMTSIKAWEMFKERAVSEIEKNLAIDLIQKENLDELTNSPAWSVIPFHAQHRLSVLHAGRVASAKEATEARAKLKEAEAITQTVNLLKSSLDSRELEISEKEREIFTLRTKVYNQLNVIERVICEPEHLDRIEPEDDTFVSGNWALLRKLANYKKQ